ncbi:hypothetical protein ASG40_12005 [Methylobacterium sp. Leaf399]|uniref:hypothetical protein n=1 Tax=unclassified Methylobacterium TaxID=2615210 RepID=UPI0006F4F84D|nr:MULTISPECIES: hypothetical protein [unclassified Methylobacterium]KQP50510.1 hypothetical protein ASF39_12520 [Methylobacterium sp. Leaf108]KQT08591.1 hypothetical protein ASG40_12005 [Methylobacterium sp. Leaf399]
MINASLQLFCNRVVAEGRLDAGDVRLLAGEILVDGIACRDEADMLIALDRASVDADPAFGDLLTALVVDFAVWGERPTGYIDAGIARWLAASLGAGSGPTPLAARIALSVVQEAQASDEHFIAFALAAKAQAAKALAGGTRQADEATAPQALAA